MIRHALVAFSLMASAALADEAHQHHNGDPHARHKAAMQAPSTQQFAPESLQIANAAVVDQNGKRRAFQEILGSGPVAVTFIYTSCTTVCPIANGIFQLVEAGLDQAGDSETRLISVSIDPERDTPEALATTAKAFEAGERWTFVTGSVPEIAALLRSFGLRLGAVEEHDPMFLVGRGGGRAFVRLVGLPAPETLLAVLDDMRLSKGM